MFDEAWISAFQTWVGLGHPTPFRVLSLLGDSWGLLLAVGLAFWVGGRKPAYATAAAAIAAMPLWVGMAELFAVPRPSGPDVVVYEQLDVGSFPSGHVFHALVVWGVASKRAALPLWTAAAAGLLTGIGRFYLGTHYPADILASLVIAPLVAWAFLALYPRVLALPAPPRPVIWGALGLAYVGLVLAVVGPVSPVRPQHWELLGIGFAAPVAVSVEYRYLESHRTTGRPVLWGVVGTTGLALLAAVARFAGHEHGWIAAVAAGLATFWIFPAVSALRS